MADPIFDHEKLDVYGLSIEYAGETFRIAETLSGLHRHSRDQWLRAAQSIPLKYDYDDAAIEHEHEHRCAEHE